MAPLVSVIMPCCNAGRMLEPALRSVFAQTHPNIEFIFVDNNSTDGSAERAQAFAAGQPRPFRFVNCREQGANHARNLGYAMASGDYIQWLDADDALGMDKVALQVEALETDRDAAIAYCDWMHSRHLPDGKRIDQVNALRQVDDQILRNLSGIWYPPHCYLLRRDAAETLQQERAWWPERKVGTDVEYSTIAAMLGMRFRHVAGAKIQYNTWSPAQTSGSGTPYAARVAALGAVWRRANDYARQPHVAPRISAEHRILLGQNWNVWAMPLDSVEIATVSAQQHELHHLASGRTIAVSPAEATIATILLAAGLSRATAHHALMIGASAASLAHDYPFIVSTLERFRREGLLIQVDPAAATQDHGPASITAPAVDGNGAPAAAASSRGIAAPAPDPLARQAVADAWTGVLRGRGLAEDQRFDVAGGDSLGLLNLAMAFEARLGVPVSLDALSLRMRPSDFARVLDRLLAGRSDPPPPAAIPSELPTIFLMRVRNHMDPSEAVLRQATAGLAQVVAIPLPAWPALATPGFTYSALVDQVAAGIAAQNRDRPVMLFGLCLGGMLASAVAQRLARSGRRIAFLGILDADATWARQAEIAPHVLAMGLAMRDRPEFSGAAPSLARWLTRHPRLLHWLERSGAMVRLPRTFATRLNWHLNAELPGSFDRSGLARLLHWNEPLDAPLFVFRSLEQPDSTPADLHWRQMCRHVTVVPVLGNHYSLFAPERLPILTRAITQAVWLALGPQSPIEAPHRSPALPGTGPALDGGDARADAGLALPERLDA